MLHGRVIARSEHEADAGRFDASGDIIRAELDFHAERLEDVGAAAAAGSRAVAVLGHPEAGAGGDESRGRRDIETTRTVAARADDIDDRSVDVHGRRMAAHGAGQTGDFLGGLPFET